MKKKLKLVKNDHFLENIEGYVVKVFHGLLLFGRLLLFVFDKIPRAMLIWGATTIGQVGVPKTENLSKSVLFLEIN